MQSNVSPTPVSKHIAILLFFVSAFSFIYLKHYVNDANSANRVALCLALLEDGTVCIDKYYHFSVDHCIRDGHYYCDKAPGASFLALPFVAAAYYGLRARGRTDFASFDPIREGEPNVNFKLLILAGSIPISLLCALAISAFYVLAVQWSTSQRAAVFGALLLGFGTPFGVWSTVIFGHAPAGAFLLFATAIGLCLLRMECPEVHGPAWAATGFLLVYAMGIEYTAAIPSLIIGCVFSTVTFRQRQAMRPPLSVAAFLVVGALPVVACFCYYNNHAFGGPFTTGYRFSSFSLMDEGFYGVKTPQWDVLVQTLFSPKHGILWFSPIVIFSPLFALRNILRNDERVLNVACLLIPLYYFLLNSSYVYWKESDIPCRHTTAALPFLALPLIFSWKTLPPPVRQLVGVLAVYGFAMGVVAMNVPGSAALATAENKPVFLLREFASGNIRNMFYYAGLPPYLTLGILLVVWTAFGVLLIGAVRKAERLPLDTKADHPRTA